MMFLTQRRTFPGHAPRHHYPAQTSHCDARCLVLEFVGLGRLCRARHRGRVGHVLSGDERQRVVFGRVLLHEPDWIFGDDARRRSTEPWRSASTRSANGCHTTLLSIRSVRRDRLPQPALDHRSAQRRGCVQTTWTLGTALPPSRHGRAAAPGAGGYGETGPGGVHTARREARRSRQLGRPPARHHARLPAHYVVALVVRDYRPRAAVKLVDASGANVWWWRLRPRFTSPQHLVLRRAAPPSPGPASGGDRIA